MARMPKTCGTFLREVEGHLIKGYADGGDAPAKALELVPGAVQDACKFLESAPDTLANFHRVTNLVEGFESPFGLELLATVHWVANETPSAGLDEVIERTYQWNERKRQFSERQIGIAYRRLEEQGWLKRAA